jgi:hypothetical protein
MFESTISESDAALLARLHAVLDELRAQDLTSRTDGQILALWRELETCRRRFAVVDHALIGQVPQRHLDFVTGARTITVLARDVLRIFAGEASARVRAAEALGPGTSFTGERLDPIYPTVAAAQASGSVAEAAARLIIGVIEKLPDQVRCEQDRRVEAFLVAQAQVLDLDALGKVARRLQATLDPDSPLKDVAYRERHRDLHVQVRRDGSAQLEGELTAQCTEWLLSVLDTLAKPRPETDGIKEPRTPGQRRHDALLTGLAMVMRAELLPHCAGITTTVLLTMTQDAYQTGDGTAVTGHGILLPAAEARRWIGGDARILPITMTKTKQVTAYGTARGLFTETQRLAMIARDHGCSMPGCDAPPQRTEAHHVIPYANGGPTTIDYGTLLCRPDHDRHEKQGWHCQMINGIPHWTAPTWIDPTQTPLGHLPLAGE